MMRTEGPHAVRLLVQQLKNIISLRVKTNMEVLVSLRWWLDVDTENRIKHSVSRHLFVEPVIISHQTI